MQPSPLFRLIMSCALIMLVAPGRSPAETTPNAAHVIPAGAPPAGVLSPSVLNEANIAIDRGLDWLAARQKENGSWSEGDYPAITALALWAFARGEHPRKEAVVKKAVAFILSCRQPDGGIYRQIEGRKGGGLSNYNTAICMTVLHELRDPALTPAILAARRFVAKSQYFGDDHFYGGMGYDAPTKRAYTDMLNTYYSVEAMRFTQDLEDLRPSGEQRVDLNWEAVARYASTNQNREEAGPADAGGFIYNPVDPKAGAVTNESGKVVFHSYGSITYAGILTLLYANVGPEDARVRSALDWAQKHWSLEENPGMGQMGLFFFYNILAKSLSATGRDRIVRAGKEPVDWRLGVAEKLIALQKHEPDTGHGYWVNDLNKYMESDPVLVTSYALVALEIAAAQQDRK